MRIKHFLKDHAYQNVPLTYDEGYELGLYALAGCRGDGAAQIRSVVALAALNTLATYGWRWSRAAERRHGHRLPEDAAEQIAGICAAVFREDIGRSEFGFLEPQVEFAVDNCGMGGDLVLTANVSTLAALVASLAGIPMCKHGSPANADSGRHGSSDFVALLGINPYATRAAVERSVEVNCFGYTEALDVRYKRIHLQTHEFARLPHMNDIIGVVTNPLTPRLQTRKVLGINHLIAPTVVARAYVILNGRGITDLQHGIFVRGFVDDGRYEGMDELSICAGGSQIAELRDGQITIRDLYPRDFGLQPVAPAEISPPSGVSKGEFSLRILRGEVSGPALDMVLANAALVFYVAGRSDSLRECFRLAEGAFRSGSLEQKVQDLRLSLSV